MGNPEQFIQEVYQVNQSITNTITESVLDQRLKVCQDFLKLQPNLQSFFWIRDSLNFELSHIHNLKYTMGYEEMDARQSIQLVHRQHLATYYRVCLALSTYCASGKLGRSILNFSFVLYLPLRDKNNQYWYVRQRSSACSINKSKQVIKFISWHDILRPYHGEPITFQGYSNQGLRVREIEREIKIASDYYDHLPFTARQQEVLKAYIKMKTPDTEVIANTTGIKKETVYTHNRDMLQRARNAYGRSFRDIYQLADFFNRHEVFDLSPDK